MKKIYKVDHINAFKGCTKLIKKFGEGNAYLIWSMGLFLDESNLEELASECLTDGNNDKKIDFIQLDTDNKRLVFAQGYYSSKQKDEAPANKAADLNTASAWLISGDLTGVPQNLRDIIISCREAINNGDIDKIDLVYSHNLPESVNVASELNTAREHLSVALPADKNILVTSRELGLRETNILYNESSSQILVTKTITCPAKIEFEKTTDKWSSAILSVPGSWLRSLYLAEGDKLFSANYRGFLGITKRRRKNINFDIKTTAEKQPENFWAYNNGITILTNQYVSKKDSTELTGISIINGAQTTGSISSLDSSLDLRNVFVIARIIKCNDTTTVEEIIKYNNTQNEITSWDKYSNDATQKLIKEEFKKYNHDYSLKRGFSPNNGNSIGIENVLQPLASLMGYFREANRGKNGLFLNNDLYDKAFKSTKVRHILFAYCVAQAIDDIRYNLKEKAVANRIQTQEEKALTLLKNLRFKYFFIALFGKCLEPILGEKIPDIKEVCFTEDASDNNKNSVESLIATIRDVVNLVLIYTVPNIKDTQQTFDNDDALNTISGTVSAMIYGSLLSGKNDMVERFKKIVNIG